MNDTIFAPATAAGRAAVAVVRISGAATRQALVALAGPLPRPRMATLRRLRDGAGGLVDQGLVLWFPGPASYTGEDSAELHLHGGPAVVDAALDALAALGLRLAEPGEFTRRAFENGKLDLAQAEGVADLIDAETAAQRRQALEQLGGRLSQVQARWTDGLVQALAMFEAAVDFPDEELPENVADRARPALEALIAEISAAAADAERGERVRIGFRIALIGAPNAGKSSLLNALVEREAAIVAAKPGTTRDIIEVPLLLSGYRALLADTAGLRETGDEIEAEGVRRAQAWASNADLRLWVVDGATEGAGVPPGESRPGDLCLIAKRDLAPGPAAAGAAAAAQAAGMAVLEITSRSPNDIAWLRRTLSEIVAARLESESPPAATRLRHRALLLAAAERLEAALQETEALELAAEDVRLAARALDQITGRIDPDAVLGRIFSTFCIGK